MKIKTVSYSKVFSLGNYENEKIGVEIELAENEDPQQAMQKARQYVEFNHKVNGYLHDLESCEHVINNPDDFTGRQVQQAKEKKAKIEEMLQTGKNMLLN